MDADGTVAAGHEPQRSIGKHGCKAVGLEAPSRGRLEHDARRRRIQVFDDGLAPASMVRELDDVGSQDDLRPPRLRREPRGRLGLDVA
jgi:hypothetical protein